MKFEFITGRQETDTYIMKSDDDKFIIFKEYERTFSNGYKRFFRIFDTQKGVFITKNPV